MINPIPTPNRPLQPLLAPPPPRFTNRRQITVTMHSTPHPCQLITHPASSPQSPPATPLLALPEPVILPLDLDKPCLPNPCRQIPPGFHPRRPVTPAVQDNRLGRDC